jgi:pimeloyl-ACP methyl ester carboxylesterase
VSRPSREPNNDDTPDLPPEPLPPDIAHAPALSRADVLRRGAFAGFALTTAGGLSLGAFPASKRSRRPPRPPRLPAGFESTFKSRFVKAAGLRQHVMVGGDGPPLLLVHGWPQNWYQYRLIMPALAGNFRVIAPDQRGMGLTDKPRVGYDPTTLANDLAELMDALGHDQFAVFGCDTGMVISYALAADHRERVTRLAVGESVVPGITPSPPLFVPQLSVSHVFHLLFNRLSELPEALVRGREEDFFGFVYAAEAGNPLPGYAVKYYIDGFASSRRALRGSFGFYRAWDVAVQQNMERAKQKLTIPVLALGGQYGLGDSPAMAMQLVADNVQGVMIPNSGHFIAEENPEAVLEALATFLSG